MTAGVSYDFSGKVVLVTGAASGIGKATALAFGESEAWVAVADMDEDRGLQTAYLIQEAGGEALFYKCDFGDANSIHRMFEQIGKHMGRIDCAFNNAGIEGTAASTVDCSEANWQKVIDINLRGVWLCMKNEIPFMLNAGAGSIVNCSSIAGLIGFQNLPAYTASKHGLLGLTKTAALEYAKQNIRINAVCPGVIQTSMVERYTKNDPEALKQLVSGEPMGRLGTPEEIASTVLWLCSDRSSFVTGYPLAVDGGWVAQ